MKKSKIRILIRAAAFLIVLGTAFSAATLALQRKTFTGEWNHMSKMREFYALPDNSVDFVCIGSSHAYCTVNPLEIYNSSGITGFVLATQQQPLDLSYYYLKEAYKYQSPKIVMIEAYMSFFEGEPDEGALYSALDPMKFSLNKLSAIMNTVPREDRLDCIFSISKYHTRWKDLTANEAVKPFQSGLEDSYCGFVCVDSDYTGDSTVPDFEGAEDIPLPEDNKEALDNMLVLTKEHSSELVLLIAPTDVTKPQQISGLKAAVKWAEENGVRVIDTASVPDEIGLSETEDYYDSNHLTYKGAAKASRYIAGVLSRMDFERTSADTSSWGEKYERYIEKTAGEK